MANNTSNNKNTKNNEAEPLENQAVTAVEVVKDDTVVYEEGDFEDYNAKHDYQEETTDNAEENESAADKADKKDSTKKSSENKDGSDKQNQQSSKKTSSDKEGKSDSAKEEASKKEDKSSKEVTATKDSESEQENNADEDEKDQSEHEDNASMTMSGMFQWASKLREDFMSEAMNITSEVTEKATAMTLQRLIAVVDMELAAFDKSVEVAKNLIANVEEERGKIADRKEKYQDMLDKIDQDDQNEQNNEDDQDK